MDEGLQLTAEEYKQMALSQINSIQIQSLQQVVSYNNPPLPVLATLQNAQLILAGNFQDIQLNPATNQAKSNSWEACRKMACRNPMKFLQACIEIFDKFETDSYLDDRIMETAIKMQGEGQIKNIISAISVAGGCIFRWAENVVKYWRKIKTQ